MPWCDLLSIIDRDWKWYWVTWELRIICSWRPLDSKENHAITNTSWLKNANLQALWNSWQRKFVLGSNSCWRPYCRSLRNKWRIRQLRPRLLKFNWKAWHNHVEHRRINQFNAALNVPWLHDRRIRSQGYSKSRSSRHSPYQSNYGQNYNSLVYCSNNCTSGRSYFPWI